MADEGVVEYLFNNEVCREHTVDSIRIYKLRHRPCALSSRTSEYVDMGASLIRISDPAEGARDHSKKLISNNILCRPVYRYSYLMCGG